MTTSGIPERRICTVVGPVIRWLDTERVPNKESQ